MYVFTTLNEMIPQVCVEKCIKIKPHSKPLARSTREEKEEAKYLTLNPK